MKARVPLIAAALTLGSAMLPACLLGYEPGVSVELTLDGEHASGESADGARFEGVEGALSLTAIELVPCGPSALRIAPIVRESLGVQRARAHHLTGDGAIHPGAVDLDGDALGVVSPGPGRYCALRVEMEPAPSAGGGLAENESLALSGRATIDGGIVEWSARGPGNLGADVPLADERGEPTAVVLDESSRLAHVVLAIDWSTVLGDVALVDRDPEDLALDIVSRLRGALHARTAPAAADP